MLILKRTLLLLVALTLLSPVILLWGGDADDFLDMGDFYFNKGDYAAALESYSQAVEMESNNVEANYKLGRAYNYIAIMYKYKDRTSRFKLASQYLTKAIQLEPDNAESHVELAKSIGHLGVFKAGWNSYTMAKRVKEELEFALDLDDDIAEAYYVLGLWHRWVSIKPYLERQPLGLGDATIQNSIAAFKKCLKYNHDCPKYKYELAVSYCEDNQRQEAIELLTEIVQPDAREVDEVILFEAQNKLKELTN